MGSLIAAVCKYPLLVATDPAERQQSVTSILMNSSDFFVATNRERHSENLDPHLPEALLNRCPHSRRSVAPGADLITLTAASRRQQRECK